MGVMKKILLVSLWLLSSKAMALVKKPNLTFNTQNQPVTVSGVSSGAFFATQMLVAYSARIRGVASIAGGIYNCAEGSAQKAQSQCMANPQAIDISVHIKKAQDLSDSGKIDNIRNLKSAKAYILAGKSDYLVRSEASIKLKDFFANWMKPEQIVTNLDLPAGHGWITGTYGNPCGQSRSPWINNCGVDIPGEFMKFLTKQNNDAVLELNQANLYEFDQSPYNLEKSGMAKTGFIYIPKKCEQNNSACRAHISFHGCTMGAEYVQTTFATNSGLNEWAEANSTIVLYPQVNKSAEMNNPNGCWDWYGYTGADYITRNGLQMKSVFNMIHQMFR